MSESTSKQSFIETVATDPDVQFHWAMESVDISCEEESKELLDHIIELWLSIRVFSLAKAWTEKYQ